MTELMTTFYDRAAAFSRLVEGAEGRWEAPSPCQGWTAADVVAHVIQTERDFLVRQGIDAGDPPNLTRPVTAWPDHLAALHRLLSDEKRVRATYDGWFGPTTLEDMMNDFYGWDLAVHGWDLARATGQENPLSDSVALRLGKGADAWGDQLYSEGICRPAVPVDADSSDAEKLLARLGRDPHWSPARATA